MSVIAVRDVAPTNFGNFEGGFEGSGFGRRHLSVVGVLVREKLSIGLNQPFLQDCSRTSSVCYKSSCFFDQKLPLVCICSNRDTIKTVKCLLAAVVNWREGCRVHIRDLVFNGTAVASFDATIDSITFQQITGVFVQISDYEALARTI